MLPFALNHMTAAKIGFADFIELAAALGCVGIEVRNDLPQKLFDGLDAAAAGSLVRQGGLRLLAVAEVKRFNDWSAERASEALALIRIAASAGAEAVSLIPRNDGHGMGNGERQANLRLALRDLKPMLEDHGLIGLIEPLGFDICSLRNKSEAVDAIEALGAKGRFKLVHDTFHHALVGDSVYHPDHTGIVHISGVIDPKLATSDMRDTDRVLVGPDDRIGNIEQLKRLRQGGFAGPISMESFAPEVHELHDPKTDLARSFDFIRSQLEEVPA